MPPYTPVKSKAQSRKLFALAGEGKIAKSEARGKTRAANFSSLPEHKGGEKSDDGPRHGKSGGSTNAAMRGLKQALGRSGKS